MNIMWGISWNDTKKGAFLALAGALLAASLATPAAQQAASNGMGDLVSVIVREVQGAGAAPERFVEETGGDVGRQIGIIRGFEAQVPSGALDALRHEEGVYSVTPNAEVRLHGMIDGYDPGSDSGSWVNTASSIKAATPLALSSAPETCRSTSLSTYRLSK
jgi:hypothetical protein